MTTQRKRFIAVGILLVLLVGIAYAFTPPFFIQFGHHYYAGSEVANAGWYRCDARSEDINDCEPTRESFVSAVANDPHIQNWLPIRAELIRL